MKLLLLCCLGFAIAAPARGWQPPRHIFPDGFVERSVAVVVRNHTATIVYSIGLNDETAKQLLADWKKQPDNSDNKPSTAPGQERSVQIRASRKTDSPRDASAANDPSAPKSLTEMPSISELKVQDQAESKDDPSEHMIDESLMEELNQLASSSILDLIKVTAEGKPVELRKIDSDIPSRHPFILTLKFQFDLPKIKECKVRIIDQNFHRLDGAARFSCKTMGKSMLLRSNVAPIIIRAERIELNELPNEARIRFNTIDVTLGYVEIDD